MKQSLKVTEWISEVKFAANNEMLPLLIWLLAVHTGAYPIYKLVRLFVGLFPRSFFVVLFYLLFSLVFLYFLTFLLSIFPPLSL